MKKLISVALVGLVISANVMAMGGLGDENGNWALDYHHTMRVNGGETLYCDENNDCRTHKAWEKQLNKKINVKEEVVYLHEIGEREAINKFNTEEIKVETEEAEKRKESINGHGDLIGDIVSIFKSLGDK